MLRLVEWWVRSSSVIEYVNVSWRPDIRIGRRGVRPT
jgi:hypothetical protein